MFIIVFILIFLVLFLCIKSTQVEREIELPENQINKTINIRAPGGIIGLFSNSTSQLMNERIQRENAKGWRVIQILPANKRSVFLFILSFILLVLTLFIYTTSNGYYILLERKQRTIS